MNLLQEYSAKFGFRFYSRLNNLAKKPLLRSLKLREPNSLEQRNQQSQVLNQKAIIVSRQVEFLNVFLGYEQANKYVIANEQGQTLGYIAEEDQKFKSSILRQLLKTRRKFNADVLGLDGQVLYRFQRPIKWFLNSRLDLCSPSGTVIGSVLSDYHLWRRKYDIFKGRNQIYHIDAPILSWDFAVNRQDTTPECHINRNFGGFVKEIFADAGQYQLIFDSETRTDELGEKQALLLAAALSIDIDYFSRHSSHSSGGMMIPFMGGGGTPAETGGAGGGGGMPMPIPIDLGGDSPGLPQADSQSGQPTDVSAKTNEWGDEILSDEDAGNSFGDDDGGSSWSDFFGDD